jgi:hypothetical protein
MCSSWKKGELQIICYEILFSTICFGIAISISASCKKDSHEVIIPTFYEKAAGIWVPYEFVQSGIVFTGPFTHSSVFAAYAESALLKARIYSVIIRINKSWKKNISLSLEFY